MEEFKNNMFNIYNLINDDKHENSLVNAKIISKQYLAYYIYRIVTKYMYLVEQSSPSKDIDFFFSFLLIFLNFIAFYGVYNLLLFEVLQFSRKINLRKLFSFKTLIT